MKTKQLTVLFVIVVAGLATTSCDSNKGKVEELATQFVTAYNEGDKASVYELWPDVKNYENLSMSGAINSEDISVEKDDSTDNYIATINKQKKQRLVFSVDSTGVISLIDTYGVFRLDSLSSEVAMKAGVPLKMLSDVTLAKLMNPQSDFIRDLKHENGTHNLWANYGAYSWGHNGSGYYVSMDFTIRNNSSQTVKGSDYYLIITPKQTSTGIVYNTKTVDGVDIAPGEMREFNVVDPPLYNCASNRDLGYNVEINYRSESVFDFLLKYGTFSGKNYEDFMAHPYRVKVRENGKYYTTSAEEKGVAYMYKEMSNESAVIDTLYHRQQVQGILEQDGWLSIYSPDYDFIGYMKKDNIDFEEKFSPLDLTEATLKSEDGKPVEVYCIEDDSVVKTYPSGTKMFMHFYSRGQMLVYERQSDGSMKEIGYATSDNIDYTDSK